MAPPILRAQHICFIKANIQKISHKKAHFFFNLIEKPYLGRVKCIVEIKDPSVDVGKLVKIHEAIGSKQSDKFNGETLARCGQLAHS